MRKIMKKESVSENRFHDNVRDILPPDHIGYVLITCKQAAQLGKMEVEVSYEGDPDLACYLVDGAQGYMENELVLGEV